MNSTKTTDESNECLFELKAWRRASIQNRSNCYRIWKYHNNKRVNFCWRNGRLTASSSEWSLSKFHIRVSLTSKKGVLAQNILQTRNCADRSSKQRKHMDWGGVLSLIDMLRRLSMEMKVSTFPQIHLNSSAVQPESLNSFSTAKPSTKSEHDSIDALPQARNSNRHK